MAGIQEAMGDLFPERGCVRPEQCDEAKVALRQLNEQVIDTLARTAAERTAWEESWLFDDQHLYTQFLLSELITVCQPGFHEVPSSCA